MKYIPAKTIVTKTKNPSSWFGTEYNMNIYKGCCHGCIYCDSRSNCYGIENFDEVRAKENALEIIRNDLRAKRNKGVICTGAMSDPYNPFEEELKLTRNALELINAYRFGVAIATKSSLVTRDMDILSDINKHSPVCVKITITTFEDDLCNKIESNVSSSSERFKSIKELSDRGIYTGILLMPILPFINDDEENILNIVKEASECGAKFIYPNFGVTLRQNQREYFYQKLDKDFPGIKEKYMKSFGFRYYCNSSKYKKLYNVFKQVCQDHGILYDMSKIVKGYKYEKEKQVSWF